jgi:peptide/nickel transport system substrate-binding protein
MRAHLRFCVAAMATMTLAGGLAACSTSGTPGSSPSGGGSGAAAGQALTVDLASYPASLDPGLQYDTDSYSVYRNIFDQLLHRNPSTEQVIPWLATAWKQQNPTTWAFTIRSGVKFSDGEPLTAADAAFSIERILDPKLASQQEANFSAIASATGSGNTLTIKTKYPSPTLLTYLTTLSVVPEAYVNKVGNAAFNLKPVGSGPYEMVSSVPGSDVKVKLNPDYWGTRPQVTSVDFRAVPDIATRVADLQSGQAQLADSMTPDNVAQLKSAGLQALSAPTERVSYLAFNTIHGGPTNSAAVRTAISEAINYDALDNDLEKGYASPVNSVATPLNVGYPKSLPDYKYDPAQAKAMIKQAGVAGQTVIMATSPTYSATIVQAIQADIQAVGLNVKIQSTDQATYLQKVQSPSHNWGSIRFGQWSCSCLDADGVAYPLFHTGTIWSSYSNPAFDKLVEQARETLSTTSRDSLYAQAYGILAKDVPGIGLFQIDAIYGASTKLQWKPDAQQDLYVADMKLSS